MQTKSAVLKSFAPVGFSLVALSLAETILLFLAKQPADPTSHYSFSKYMTLRALGSYWKHIALNKIVLYGILAFLTFLGCQPSYYCSLWCLY